MGLKYEAKKLKKPVYMKALRGRMIKNLDDEYFPDLELCHESETCPVLNKVIVRFSKPGCVTQLIKVSLQEAFSNAKTYALK